MRGWIEFIVLNDIPPSILALGAIVSQYESDGSEQ